MAVVVVMVLKTNTQTCRALLKLANNVVSVCLNSHTYISVSGFIKSLMPIIKQYPPFIVSKPTIVVGNE